MIEIRDINGTVLLQLLNGNDSGAGANAVPMNEGSVLHCELMQGDYIILKFRLATPILFKRGCYTTVESKKYILQGNYKPSYNTDSGAYEYSLQMDAWYYDWQRFILTLNPRFGAHESSFSLTAKPEEHFKLILSALRAHNMNIYSGTPSMTYNEYMSGTGSTEAGYVAMLVNDGCVEVSCNFQYKTGYDDIANKVENRAYMVQYESMDILSALNAMCEEDAFNCEWWVSGSVVNFGRCEFYRNSPVDLELGKQLVSLSQSESSGDYATRIIGFGSSRNIPSRYRKSLVMGVTDIEADSNESVASFSVNKNISAVCSKGSSSSQYGYTQSSLSATKIGSVNLTAGELKMTFNYSLSVSKLQYGYIRVYLKRDGFSELLLSISSSNNASILDIEKKFSVPVTATYDLYVEADFVDEGEWDGEQYSYQPTVVLGESGGDGSIVTWAANGKYLVMDSTRKIFPKWFKESAKNYQDGQTFDSLGGTSYTGSDKTRKIPLSDKIFLNGSRRFNASLDVVIKFVNAFSAKICLRAYNSEDIVTNEDIMSSTEYSSSIYCNMMGTGSIVASSDALYVVVELEVTQDNPGMVMIMNHSVTVANMEYQIQTTIKAGNVSYTAVVNPHYKDIDSDEAAWIQIENNIALGTKFTLPDVIRGRVPLYMFTNDIEKDTTTINSEVRLMLPEATCPHNYIDADNIKDSEGNTIEGRIVEKVLELDYIYPSKVVSIDKVETYEQKQTDPSDETGISTLTVTNYRIFIKKSDFDFDSDYIQTGQTLQMVFQSGLLAGMTFDADFEGDCTGANQGLQSYVVVQNSEYGVNLPNVTLHPSADDTIVFVGYDTSYLSEEGNTLLVEAEKRLEKEIKARLDLMSKDNATYTATLMCDYAYGLDDYNRLDPEFAKRFELGRSVNIIDAGLSAISTYIQVIDGDLCDGSGEPIHDDNGEKLKISYNRTRKDCVISRVIGFDVKLDIPHDNPQYIIGESEAYSRLATLQKQITK